MWGVIVSAIAGFVVGLFTFAKFIAARVSKEDMEAILLQAVKVNEVYQKATREESEQGKEISREEWVEIAKEGATLAGIILKAIKK